jgi:iron(III) transport system ATP-binding protein
MTNDKKSGIAVRLTRLAKRYGGVTAIKPLDLVIEAGTLVTLLGPSGCGKTTLLRLIAGLEAASEGEIQIGEVDVTRLSARERDVSMVFQSYALFPHMDVLDNVAYGLISGGNRRAMAKERAREALKLVGLADLSGRFPSELSGGQQQRVALARALVIEPKVLLFDEPLSNLDARLRRQMREEIRALQQRLGLTVVYVTHDQAEALAVSDRIVVMRNAEIAQAGTPTELYEAPASTFVASFMGEANVISAAIESVQGEMARVCIGDTVFELPSRGYSVGPIDLVIRPEAAQIIANQPHCRPALPGEVTVATYMGSWAEYVVETTIGRLLVVSTNVAEIWPVRSRIFVALAGRGVLVTRDQPTSVADPPMA